MKINVHSKNFHAAEHLLDFINKKAMKLEQYFDRITSIDVYLSLNTNNHAIKEKEVKVKIDIPGKQIIAIETSNVFEDATAQAIDAARRQLKKYKAKLRN